MAHQFPNRHMIVLSHAFDGDRLVLRFGPERLCLDANTPVLRFEIADLAAPETAEQKIAAIQDPTSDSMDIDADDRTLSVMTEFDDEPHRFEGKVSWRQEAYALSDYIDEIRRRDRIEERSHKEKMRSDSIISDTMRFIDRTADRIEKRQAMRETEDDNDARQLQLLREVRRHLKAPTE